MEEFNIEKSEYNTFNGGAFSDTFIKDGKIYKLFINYNHSLNDGTGKEDLGEERFNSYRRKVFESEVEAYEKIQHSELLKKHTPTFHGKVKVDKVTENGKDISSRYLLDCCYLMDYIEGIPEKLNDIIGFPSSLKEVEKDYGFNWSQLLEEFKKMKVFYIKDAHSVRNKHEFKIIDFGTVEIEQPIIGM